MARKFIVDGREFPDPDPSKSPEEVRRMMTDFFPELSTATTQEHKQGDDTAYEFIRRTGTKGRKGSKSVPIHCAVCATDKNIACPRDVDAQCAHCGGYFCGGHIGGHLKSVHCVSLDLDYVTRKD
ncbi:MAG TPA: PRTRC system protein C [Dehalococcoidia bacterium]|nr:PRTRC system protein C [Dehalococcoidia bacterium]